MKKTVAPSRPKSPSKRLASSLQKICLASSLSLLAPAQAQSPTGLPDVQIQNDHMTVLYGGSFVEKIQENGTFEAFLQASDGEQKSQYRSMAYSGDQVGFRIRASRFGKHMAYLVNQWEADRVLMAFGGNESHRGIAGLAKFEEELRSYLMVIEDRHAGAELVLISPISVEKQNDLIEQNLAQRNADLALYSQKMKEVAGDLGITFIDLHTPTMALFAQSADQYTDNGVHLNDTGANVVGKMLAEKLIGKDAIHSVNEKSPGFQALKGLVSRKAAEVFQAYHPSNGISYYGTRARSYEYLPEIPHYLKLANTLDQAIWKQAESLDTALPKPELEILKIEVEAKAPKKGLGTMKTSAEDLKDFTLAEDFQVNCFATSEEFPELINPLQIQTDARGRIWVTCYASYPHPLPGDTPKGSVLIFEDTDQDGKADKMTKFAENLYLPDGFVFYKEGVLVAINRMVIYLEDRDGDGKADYRKEILRGLDNTDTHHSGYLARTPQGRLEISEGLFHRGQFETPQGVLHTKDATMMTLDLDTRGLTIERQTSHPNPWKITYNQYGEAIQFYGGGQIVDVDLYNVWMPSGRRSISGHLGIPFRYDKGCTAQLVESAHFPADWQGGLLTGHLLSTNEVNFTKMKYHDGAYRSASKKLQLISSSNKTFRPTDITFGLDGSLMISDFYYPIIGHAQHSVRDKNRDYANGRIWRVTHKTNPLLKAPQIEGRSLEDLLDLLGHPHFKVRQLVRVELEKLDTAHVLAATKKRLHNVNTAESVALEYLWLLERLRNFDELSFYRSLIRSENTMVQQAAVRSLRYWGPHHQDAALAIAQEVSQTDNNRLKVLLVGAASHLQRTEPAWAKFLKNMDPKGSTIVKTVLDMASQYQAPSLSAEYPVLKAGAETLISDKNWVRGKQKLSGTMFFKLDKPQNLIIGHQNQQGFNLTINDTPILLASGKHTKSSQTGFSAKSGINKVEYHITMAKKLDPNFTVNLSDKLGRPVKGLSYAKDLNEHQAWAAIFEKAQSDNWQEFAQNTFAANCANCHEIGQNAVGPALKGLLGKTQSVIYKDGSKKEITVDEKYIRQAIVDPQSVYPEGFHPLMAPLPLSEKEVDSLVRWIKTL